MIEGLYRKWMNEEITLQIRSNLHPLQPWVTYKHDSSSDMIPVPTPDMVFRIAPRFKPYTMITFMIDFLKMKDCFVSDREGTMWEVIGVDNLGVTLSRPDIKGSRRDVRFNCFLDSDYCWLKSHQFCGEPE